MARALPSINTKFKGAVQKTEQEKKIAELQAEVEQLRAASAPQLEAEIENLRNQIQQSSGEVEIDVELIEPNPNQPRQTITGASIQNKARLLKKHGQITSVILVPYKDNRYMLLDGQLRWEAARILGWKTIRAVIVPQPQDLEQSSLLTFLGFEDLNPLDKAEAIVREIVKTTDFEEEEISATLATVIKRIERDGKTKELAKLIDVSSEEQQQGLTDLNVVGAEQDMFLILLELGLNPVSFRTNLIPMLSLPQDLKDAIRSSGLKGAHALALSTLTAKALSVEDSVALKERARATGEVLKKNLTVPETRERIREIKAKYLTVEKTESKEVKVVMQKINSLTKEVVEGASREQLAELKELLQQKLTVISEALT